MDNTKIKKVGEVKKEGREEKMHRIRIGNNF